MSESRRQGDEQAMTVTAVYELPVPIWVMSDALEGSYPTGVGPVSFDVVMPLDREPVGAPPDVLEQGWTTDDAGDLIQWTVQYAGTIPPSLQPAKALRRVVITNVQAPRDEQREWRTADHQLAEVIASWFDAVRTWAEILTGQDLDPGHRVYDATPVGEGLTFIEPPHDGLAGINLTTQRVRPLRARKWGDILDAVGRDSEPPLEEVLSRDARAAHRRGAYRRAILEAGTALEIALGQHVRDHKGHLKEYHQKRINDPKDHLGLGNYIDMAAAAELELAVSIDALREVKDLRNDAAHHGEAPGAWATGEVVQRTINFLAAHGRYRRSADDEPDGSEWVPVDPEE